jgi:hypothetical protein
MESEMITIYQHSDPNKNIGNSGRRFSVFYRNGGMWCLYENMEIKFMSMRDDRQLLERYVESGEITKKYIEFRCNHEWNDVITHLGDLQYKSSRKCSKCNKKEFINE